MSQATTRRDFIRQAGLAGATALFGRQAGASDELVYSNARILFGTMPGQGATEVHGGLRIRDGQLVEVGAGVGGGIDLGGAVVWPGSWDSGTTAGIAEIGLEVSTKDDSETSDPMQPQARVTDAFNPDSALFPVLRGRGVMGVLVTPGGGVVSGQAAWMRTHRDDVGTCALMAPAGLVINLGRGGVSDKGPSSRMGVVARLRDALDANPPPKDPEKDGAKKTNKAKKALPVDPAKKPPTQAERVWHELLLGNLRAIFVADRASDIVVAMELMDEYTLDGVILGASEGWRVARELADRRVPVVVGPVTTQPDSFDHLGARYDNAALLHKAGVPIALRIGDPHRAFDLTTEAGIAVAHGLPWEVAIAAISGNSPGFFGLSNGQIGVGREATFVVSDGDPLEPRSSVKRVVVRGMEVALTSRQTELYDRFKVLK